MSRLSASASAACDLLCWWARGVHWVDALPALVQEGHDVPLPAPRFARDAMSLATVGISPRFDHLQGSIRLRSLEDLRGAIDYAGGLTSPFPGAGKWSDQAFSRSPEEGVREIEYPFGPVASPLAEVIAVRTTACARRDSRAWSCLPCGWRPVVRCDRRPACP